MRYTTLTLFAAVGKIQRGEIQWGQKIRRGQESLMWPRRFKDSRPDVFASNMELSVPENSLSRNSHSRRWLPKFDLVALRIHDPTELPVLGIVRLLEYVTSFVSKCLK